MAWHFFCEETVDGLTKDEVSVLMIFSNELWVA